MQRWLLLILTWIYGLFVPPALAAESGSQDSAYAGVAVEPPALSAQEKWPILQGGGLEVVDLDPEGPSAEAGVRLNDILLQWNDQRLFNPGQLRALVRTLAPGSHHQLQVLRAGAVQAVDVQLGARSHGTNAVRELRVAKVPFETWNSDTDWPAQLEDLSPAELGVAADNVVREIPNGLAEWLVDHAGTTTNSVEWLVLLQAKTNTAAVTRLPLPGAGLSQALPTPEPSAPLGMVDDQGSVEVRQRGGRMFAVVRDAQGAVLYEGPLESEEHFLLLRPLRPGLREIIERSVGPDRAVLPPVEVEVWRLNLPPRVF